MKKLIVLFAFLAACTTDDADPQTHECGPAPRMPGYVVSFETINGFDRALLTRDDWENLNAWQFDITRWSQCVNPPAPCTTPACQPLPQN